jgi:SHS family lactate transporter-like MFS transporter
MSAQGSWTAQQRHVVIAAFLGWTLDAFDFFLMVFVFKAIAADFHTSITRVTIAVTLTLAVRPIGAFIFGRLADRFGRRPTLMLNVLLYSVLEFASGLAPSLGVLLLLRALFGVAMGGVWGVGASLALESVPVKSRGFVSGLLQVGYPTGYLLAAIVFGLLFDHIGWRGMFMIGVAPALLVVYLQRKVPESPSWLEQHAQVAKVGIGSILLAHWKLALYAVVMMTAFNFFSHGTQDLYPTFLQTKLPGGAVSTIAIIYNIGAICGGLTFGTLSERIGRRRAIATAALLSLAALPLWAFGVTPVLLAVGAFIMQFMVQGAWGVVPAHLNELSPAAARATFPGFVYQLGNLLASYNVTLEAKVAEGHGTVAMPDYAFALAVTAGIVAVVLAVVVGLGPERRNVAFTGTQAGAPE